MPNNTKILLVDDELDIIDSLRIGLEENGFTVETHTDSFMEIIGTKMVS